MPKGSPELVAARKEEIIAACEKLYQTMSFKDITINLSPARPSTTTLRRKRKFSSPSCKRSMSAGAPIWKESCPAVTA